MVCKRYDNDWLSILKEAKIYIVTGYNVSLGLIETTNNIQPILFCLILDENGQKIRGVANFVG